MSNDDRFSADDHYTMRPAKKSSGGRWVFGIVGCVVAAVFAPFLLMCGCCGGLMQWGMNEKGKEMIAAVEADETFQAEIGQDATASINWSASMSAGEDIMVFDVSGEKGSGQIFVHEPGDIIEKIVLHKGSEEWDLTFDPEMVNESSMDAEMVAAIEGDATIQKEIGAITICQMDLGESIKEDDPDVFVYTIVGDKGRGEISAKFDDDDQIIWAKLKKDGQTYDLKLWTPLGEIENELDKL